MTTPKFPVLPALKVFALRYFLVPWIMIVVLITFISRDLWRYRTSGKILTVILLCFLSLSAFTKNRSIWDDYFLRSRRMSLEGKFFYEDIGKDEILRKPLASPYYFTGLTWLKKGNSGIWFYDDIYLCEHSLINKKIWEYSSLYGRMMDVTAVVADIKDKYCGKIREDASLSVSVEYKQGLLYWRFGPYKEGQYSFLLDDASVKFNVSPEGSHTGPLAEEVVFRVGYHSPEGWASYTPYLKMDIKENHGRIRWERPLE